MSWRNRVRAPLRASSAYPAPPTGGLVKLDANESPWPISDAARAAITSAVATLELHRYPDPTAAKLRAALASRLGVLPAQLVLGNGSDELIAILCGTFGEPVGGAPARVLYPSPTFVMFKQEALTHGLVPIEVPLAADFSPDVDAMVTAIRAQRPSLVFLATPNNPTGTVWPDAAIDRLLAADDEAIIVIDEAYLAYGAAPSALPRVAQHERCVVLQTLSKIGLAGLRVGYLVAQQELAAELEKARPPYNLDVYSQAAATAVLTHAAAELEVHALRVRNERARLIAALRAHPALEVFPSGGNFVLVRHAHAAELDRALREEGVAVRCFERGTGGPLAGCLRITVGTPAEDDCLLAALARALL